MRRNRKPGPPKSSRTRLREVSREDCPSRFLDYKDFLKCLYERINREQAGYRFQDFSKDLNLPSPGTSYVITHGQRKLNKDYARLIVESLQLTGCERQYFLKLVTYTDCKNEDERSELFRELVNIRAMSLPSERDRLFLQFFNEWQHTAIFELMALPNFRSDPEWIAEQFYSKVSKDQVRKSLTLLEKLELAVYDPEGQKHRRKVEHISPPNTLVNLSSLGYHLQMLDLAKASLSSVPSSRREVGAVTVHLPERLVHRFMEDLRMFRRYLLFAADQTDEPAQHIVQINLQCFPLTRM